MSDTFCCSLRDLIDDQAAKIFPIFSGNQTLTKFTNLTEPEKLSFGQTKAAFKKNFAGLGGVLFDSYHLLLRDQTIDKPLDTYLKYIYKFLSKTNYSEEMKIALFVRGLQPKVRKFVIVS